MTFTFSWTAICILMLTRSEPVDLRHIAILLCVFGIQYSLYLHMSAKRSETIMGIIGKGSGS